MTKALAVVSTTFITACLLAGCSSMQKPADTPIGYHGTGDVTEYHPNGKIKRQAEYLNGELVSAVLYYPSGTEASHEQYAMGELSEATYYFADGRVKTRISGK